MGLPLLGVTAAGTAYFINKTFRDALYLDFRLRISSYLGLMAVSGMSAVAGHFIVSYGTVLALASVLLHWSASWSTKN